MTKPKTPITFMRLRLEFVVAYAWLVVFTVVSLWYSYHAFDGEYGYSSQRFGAHNVGWVTYFAMIAFTIATGSVYAAQRVGLERRLHQVLTSAAASVVGAGLVSLVVALFSQSRAALGIEPITGLMGFSGTIVALVLASVPRQRDMLWLQFRNVSRALITGFGFGFVLFVGLMFAVLIFSTLFAAPMGPGTPAYLAVISFIAFGLSMALMRLQPYATVTDTTVTYNRLVVLFLKVVVVPIVLIYASIESLYLLLVVLAKNLPSNQLVYLILVLVLPGLALANILAPRLAKPSLKVLIFTKAYLLVSLASMLLYFYAIIVRINEYGYTVDRVYIVLFGVFITLTLAYFLVFRRPSVLVPAVLFCLLLVLPTFMPVLNPYTISANSQFARLEQLLIKHNILQNGKVVKRDLDYPGITEIRSVLDYLVATHGLNAAKPWFTDAQWRAFGLNDRGFDTSGKRYETNQRIMNNIATYYYEYAPERSGSTQIIRLGEPPELNVPGATFYYVNTYQTDASVSRALTADGKGIKLNTAAGELEVDMTSVIDKLAKLPKEGVYYDVPNVEDLTFTVQQGNKEVRLVINTATIYQGDQDDWRLTAITAFVFVLL